MPYRTAFIAACVLATPAVAQQSATEPDVGWTEPVITGDSSNMEIEGVPIPYFPPSATFEMLAKVQSPDQSNCIRLLNRSNSHCNTSELFPMPVYKPADPAEPCVSPDPAFDRAACLYLLEELARHPS